MTRDRHRRHRGLSGAAWFAAGAALLSGCATVLPPSAKLSPVERASLEQVSREPREIGVEVVAGGKSRQLRSVWRVRSRPFGTAPFVSSRQAREPLVLANVNGRQVFALVDTGAGGTLMEAAAAIRVGVVPLREPRIESRPGDGALMLMQGQALGACFSQFLGVARDVEIGGLRVEAVPVGILDLAGGLGRRDDDQGRRPELLLGADFLKLAGRVTFDFPGNRMLFGDPESALRGRRIVTMVPLVESSPVPLIELEAEGLGNIAMAIDTGGDFDLWLPLCVGGDLPVERLGLSFVHVGMSVGGRTMSVPTMRRRAYVGGQSLGAVKIEVDMFGRFASPVPYGLIGRGILKRYVVVIDYEQGWVTLAE